MVDRPNLSSLFDVRICVIILYTKYDSLLALLTYHSIIHWFISLYIVGLVYKLNWEQVTKSTAKYIKIYKSTSKYLKVSFKVCTPKYLVTRFLSRVILPGFEPWTSKYQSCRYVWIFSIGHYNRAWCNISWPFSCFQGEQYLWRDPCVPTITRYRKMLIQVLTYWDIRRLSFSHGTYTNS